MRILMLGWELPPHNSGGLGVACYQLCKHLAAHGVDIDFVVPYTETHDIEFMTVRGAEPYPASVMQTILGGAYDSQWFEREAAGYTGGLPRSLREQQQRYTTYIRQLVQEEGYDVVHAHDWLTYEAALAAKSHLGAPLVAHVHATEFDRAGGGSGNSLVHEIEYTGLLMADRIMAVSRATKDLIVEKYQIPADKIEVVHNSIDPDDFEDVLDPDSYAYITHMKAQGYAVVASVGRLTIQKGLTFLLQAAREALAHNPKILFIVAGSGEQYRELIELSAEYGISANILFTGFVRGRAWRDVFALADMFVMPSVSEPFGLVALEAAGYGNAVLISRQSGVGEVLKNVLRFDFWDTSRLANQIVALAESPGMQQALLSGAREEFQHLSWRKVAEQCVRSYENLNRQEVAV